MMIMLVCRPLGVDWTLAAGIASVESNFSPDAIGASGEVGLFQIMPREAGYGFSDRPPAELLRDPVFNTMFACSLLSQLAQKYGDENLAVAAYHLGPGRVKDKVPPTAMVYVNKVNQERKRISAYWRSSEVGAALGGPDGSIHKSWFGSGKLNAQSAARYAGRDTAQGERSGPAQ
jgi:soluble lytic murein transglycosylase-like protein